MATFARTIESEIADVAYKRGFVDATVSPQSVRFPSSTDSGDWFVLAVKLDSWHVVGRRRTRSELLELVKTLDVADVGGKRFGRCRNLDEAGAA